MRYQHDNGPPLFTYALLATLVAFFGAQMKGSELSAVYAFQWRIADGQFWRLITCTFMHGSVLHIVFNAVLFFRFSHVIDNWLGPWAALALYVLLATGASAAQMLVSQGAVIGASGVVYGFFGFLWVMARRRDDAALAANKHTAESMIGWLIICAVVNNFGGHIGNTAHIYGLLLGWLVGQCFIATRSRRAVMITLTLAVWALPMVLTLRPVWQNTLAHVPMLQRQYIGYFDPPDAATREHEEHPPEWPRPGLTGMN